MRYVFIVSYARSGSTLLMSVLNAIPGYCIRGENGGVVAPMAESDRLLRQARTLMKGHYDGPSSPWYGFSQVDPDAWRAERARVFTEHILAPPPGTRVSGFKEVRYTPEDMDDELFHATIDFLAEGFGDARIVFNMRTAQEVARSAWWKTHYPSHEVESFVATCDPRFGEAHRRLGARRSFMIRYADYDAKPAGFLPLLDWLGEELPAATLEAISGHRLVHFNHKQRPWPVRMLRRAARALRG